MEAVAIGAEDVLFMGDFHDGDRVRSRSTGADMVVHHDGDPWLAEYYVLVECHHQD